MKLFISASSWFLLIVGAALMVLPLQWFPSFYDARYTGAASLIGAFAIQFVPKLLGAPHDARKESAVREFQFLITLFIMANAAGELGLFYLFKNGFQYDKLLHFSISFVSVWRIPVLLEKRYDVRPKRALGIVLASVILAGILWEVYEFIADAVWHTRLDGVFGTSIRSNTIADLTTNGIGAISGAFVALYRLRKVE